MLIIVLTLSCFGCQKQPEAVDVLDVYSTSVPENDPAQPVSSGKGLEVISTAAYIFEQDDALQLYGAVEYINNGSSPLYLSGAVFNFTSTGSMSFDFTPILAQYNVLEPGERAYAAAWFPAEGFDPGESPSLQVELSSAHGEPSPVHLAVEDVFFADNYPGFTTMTGTLVNTGAQSCSLNMVYVGLYDANDVFLGAWYFSQNALLDSQDSVRFTTHLKAFPLNKLAETGVHSQCLAFGFN